MATASGSGTQSTTRRLLTCFCGCTQFTEEDVKRIYRLSAQETLINIQACNLFQKFLEKERSGDKSEAEQFLDVYKLCEQYLREEILLTEDEVEALIDVGLPYVLEKAIRLEVRTGDRYNIERCLLRIQGNCRNEIEASGDYKRYKQAILNKLKNVRT